MGKFSLTLVAVFVIFLFDNGVLSENLYTKSKTILELISATNRLRQVSMMINDSGLSRFFEQNDVTAFIPTTKALLTFDEKRYGYDLTDRDAVRSLLLYHIVAGTYLEKELPEVGAARSLHPSGYNVFFNEFTDGDDTVFTVNGAVIITSNITASNGVLHIIDRVMAPITSPKTLHDYIMYPDMPRYSFSSINNASIVDLDLKMWTKDIHKNFTLFLPDDHHLVHIPEYGQKKLFSDWYLIRKVYHAHTVRDKLSFIPSKGDIPTLTSMQGDVKFYRENGKVYVKNNGVKAMVLQPNIPTVNGVIHVIDNLLYFVYMNIVQTLERLPNTQTFKLYLDRPSIEINMIKSYLTNGNRTVFVPTDTAFAKLPSTKQQQFNSDVSLLIQTLNNHIINAAIHEVSLVNGLTLISMSNKTMTVIKDDDGIYIETEDMQITVEETDIGCTNGVIHLISNVIIKNDYTVWQAIDANITQLGKMRNVIKNFSDLSSLLNNVALHITVFLPIDYVMEDIPGSILSDFGNNPDLLYNAVSGHIILGHTLTTLNMTDGEMFLTYGGHQLRTTTDGKDISVTGSYISAHLIISDIMCSNGVIHVIDNLMHIPTRNVLEEMKRHSDISVISSFVGLFTMTKLQVLLSNEDEDITIFVPTNKAFYDIPKSRANKLLMDSLLLERILQAHVVTSGTYLVQQLYSHQSLISEEDTIYVRKTNNTVSLVSNNVHSTITTSNIRATNGVIHMVDRMLYYPYFTVAETMSKDDRLIPFFDMMFKDDDFQQMSESESSDMTVFVPSPVSLQNITATSSILTQLFLGHVLPGVKLDLKYLRNHNSASLRQQGLNNVTFSLVNQTIGYSVDVGYSNLRQYFNIISDGIACSNGIIYMINGLLNYNILTLLQEIRQDSRLLHSLNYMLQFWPADSEENLRSTANDITLFLPDASVFDSLSGQALDFLDNITNEEKEQFQARHIITGSLLTINDISRSHRMKNNVQVVLKNDEMFLQWNTTVAKIVRSNILASNGIIHIIDKLFIDLPEVPTTVSPDGTTKKSAHVNSAVLHCSFKSLTLIILSFCVYIFLS